MLDASWYILIHLETRYISDHATSALHDRFYGFISVSGHFKVSNISGASDDRQCVNQDLMDSGGSDGHPDMFSIRGIFSSMDGLSQKVGKKPWVYYGTMWGPPVISWFRGPNNYSYKYHKP